MIFILHSQGISIGLLLLGGVLTLITLAMGALARYVLRHFFNLVLKLFVFMCFFLFMFFGFAFFCVCITLAMGIFGWCLLTIHVAACFVQYFAS